MYYPLFSLATALTVSSIIKTTSAGVAGLINPRRLDERQLCRGDSYYDVFNSVGMGRAGEGAQNDIEDFCYSWIPFRTVTSYYVTITPTTTCFPATVTVNRTTEIVYSPTSTVTVTASQTEFAIEKRGHVRKDAVEGRVVAAAITQRAELPKRMIQHARRAISASARSLDVEDLKADLSSACSCLFLPAPTTILPSTAPEVTRTIGATNYATATLNTTVAGGVTTITVTLNVTSLVRPTEAASQLSGTVPTPSSNSTTSGPGNGIDVDPTFNTRPRPTGGYGNGIDVRPSSNSTISGPGGIDVRPTFNTRPRPTGGYGGYGTGQNYGTGYSHGTGTGSWPQPTKNSTCPACTAGTRNVTVTVTALATSTVLSTATDIISDIIFKNTTITVTAAEATVTLAGFTITEDETTVTETVVEGVPTITEPGVTETVTESEETATVTISVPTTVARAADSAY